MKDLPLLTDDNRVEDKREIRILHARLEKTLKFFERDQVVDVIIFRHPQPIVYSKPGVVILISTEVLKIVRDDDDALVGVIAHELAHEYVALEFLKALQSGNLSRMRELELFCDAIAVVAMLQLGFDPSLFARAVKMIAKHSHKSAELNGGENSHPAVEARLRVVSYVSKLIPPAAKDAKSETGTGKSRSIRNILSKIDESIVQKMEQAWRGVGAGRDNKEAVLLLFRMADGSLEARPEAVTNEHKELNFKWHPSAIAIVHTHPNSCDPKPSEVDKETADKLGVPIFTVTVRGMFVYHPQTKKVTQIMRGLDWLEVAKWKSAACTSLVL